MSRYNPIPAESVEAWEISCDQTITIAGVRGTPGDFLVRFPGGRIVVMNREDFLSKYQQEATKPHPGPFPLPRPRSPWQPWDDNQRPYQIPPQPWRPIWVRKMCEQ